MNTVKLTQSFVSLSTQVIIRKPLELKLRYANCTNHNRQAHLTNKNRVGFPKGGILERGEQTINKPFQTLVAL